MTWHADEVHLRAFVGGELAGARAESIEQHVVACGECRRRLGERFDRGRMGKVWDDVVDEIDRPRRSWLEAALVRVGMGSQTARLVAVTPTLRASWLVGVLVTLAFFVIATEALGAHDPALFLLAAPLVPLAAVAVAFGTQFDPVGEVTRAAPVSKFRLLLVRTVAVLLGTIPLVLIAEQFLDVPVGAGARWLLPSLAMVTGTLALSTRLEPVAASMVVGGAWVVVLALVAFPAGTAQAGQRIAESFVFSAGGQLLSLLAVIAGSWWIVSRRETIEIGRLV